MPQHTTVVLLLMRVLMADAGWGYLDVTVNYANLGFDASRSYVALVERDTIDFSSGDCDFRHLCGRTTYAYAGVWGRVPTWNQVLSCGCVQLSPYQYDKFALLLYTDDRCVDWKQIEVRSDGSQVRHYAAFQYTAHLDYTRTRCTPAPPPPPPYPPYYAPYDQPFDGGIFMAWVGVFLAMVLLVYVCWRLWRKSRTRPTGLPMSEVTLPAPPGTELPESNITPSTDSEHI